MDKEEIGFGGFFIDNIRKWLVKECLESGDPENMFLNILDVIHTLEDELIAGITWEGLSETYKDV